MLCLKIAGMNFSFLCSNYFCHIIGQFSKYRIYNKKHVSPTYTIFKQRLKEIEYNVIGIFLKSFKSKLSFIMLHLFKLYILLLSLLKTLQDCIIVLVFHTSNVVETDKEKIEYLPLLFTSKAFRRTTRSLVKKYNLNILRTKYHKMLHPLSLVCECI